jgi:phosphatidylglycerol:prolipoprotein diacylglycerol transferase
MMFSMPLLALIFPQIDPFVFRFKISGHDIGLSWYAFTYLLGFSLSYLLLRHRFRKGLFRVPELADVSLLVTYCFYGIILGARLGYVVFYNWDYFKANPWEIPAIWHGGMSFHGGLIGLILAMWLYARKLKVPFYHVTDNVTLCAPIGLGFGRIGNFINGELYGRVTDSPLGMVFPRGGPLPRHPSQLYESVLEGLVLFLLLAYVIRKEKYDGIVSVMGLIGYGVLRFIVEFFREPDAQLGFIIGTLTMGQLLCLAMVLGGIVVWWDAWRRSGPKVGPHPGEL